MCGRIEEVRVGELFLEFPHIPRHVGAERIEALGVHKLPHHITER